MNKHRYIKNKLDPMKKKNYKQNRHLLKKISIPILIWFSNMEIQNRNWVTCSKDFTIIWLSELWTMNSMTNPKIGKPNILKNL